MPSRPPVRRAQCTAHAHSSNARTLPKILALFPNSSTCLLFSKLCEHDLPKPIFYMYMLGTKCGFGPFTVFFSKTADHRFAHKSADSADNPRIAQTLAQTLNVTVAAVSLQMRRTLIGEHDRSLRFLLLIAVCSVPHAPLVTRKLLATSVAATPFINYARAVSIVSVVLENIMLSYGSPLCTDSERQRYNAS